jgi:hypothetical protein
MSIVVTQSGSGGTPVSAATTTVQQVVDCTSQDIRKLLANSGTDEAILIDYVNRVHLDMLRFSRWRFLLSGVKTFNTVVGESDYWIGNTGGQGAGQTDTGLNLTDVRVIKMGTVFDRTNHKPLAKTGEQPLGDTWTDNNRPKVWRNDVSSPNVIQLWPPADGIYAIEFRYYKVHTQLTIDSQVLLVPDDYKDIVCAGVNELANMYLKRPEEAQYWHAIYEEGKREMIRDANQFPRGEEFIRPDYSGVAPIAAPIEVSIP